MIPKLNEYDDLVNKAHEEFKAFRARADSYVPKMYKALRAEGVEPMTAKERIETDLADIWRKDTIRRLLPDEAKNTEQSEAARKRNRRKKAGMNPASPAEMVSVNNDGSEELQWPEGSETTRRADNHGEPATRLSKVAIPDDRVMSEVKLGQLRNRPSDQECCLTQETFVKPETIQAGEVILGIEHLAGIFAQQKNGAKEFYLKHNGLRVIGVESDLERQKEAPKG